MATFYDARGNVYAVISPDALRAMGIDLPASAAQAALSRQCWTTRAVATVCDWPTGERPQGSKAHRSDGLLVGPFQQAAPFDILIVNTDGTLAERSGNGLTIFSQSLADSGRLANDEGFTLHVHHDHGGAINPSSIDVFAATVEGVPGFWLDIGTPDFGPAAVGAVGSGLSEARLGDAVVHRVDRLARLQPDWHSSAFVRVGNPHCVTLVVGIGSLPTFEALHNAPLNEALTRIAFARGEFGDGEPCPAGINLQWAANVGANRIVARVFERGEGPTASSGTSASAVACAAWRVGWVSAGLVEVVMPGGTAPVRLLAEEGLLRQVHLFGTAKLQQ
ncbi:MULTISPECIES: diaminopimelate epimerase [unclassified Pseudomonas]|uniref:diaminopimelate epimerase n=1 Tax=unclassified Pseudomonas TaxID=196821 RepID=UPI000D3D1DE6|nr:MULTISPECIES: diaminopimelate epimerase [unclassified Pseudomonas]RAU47575.1 diaminopimelate epimerase [Pseudomonas sp. RIT 409]RAU49033.1 diaminopimelate epimerase [Pseudomonas sp. RIT 412]